MKDEPKSSSKGRRKKPLPVWQEVILLLVTAFVLALVVKTFFVQAFYIPSGSMEPTLQVDDKILVQKISYWTGEIKRGDIAVFDDPGGWLRQGQGNAPRNVVQQGLEMVGLYPSGGHLVKRVIGIGGDTVKCCNRAGMIVVNGVALKEDYLPETTKNQPTKLRRSRIGAATSKLSRKPSKKFRTTPGFSYGQSPVVTRTTRSS